MLFNSFVYLTDNEAENMIFSKYDFLLRPAVSFHLLGSVQSLTTTTRIGEVDHTTYIGAWQRYSS